MLGRSTGVREALGILALVGALSLVSCGIPVGSSFKLGVPFRQQEEFNYCVPASILMWRLYDGLPEITQSEIWNWLGGPPCTPDEVPAGVAHFTRAYDAYLDLEYIPTELERNYLIARQIMSVGESRVPVIAVVGVLQNHVGVIDGGKYHQSGSVNVWDFVYFHDPEYFFGDDYYSASEWIDFFCSDFSSYCAQILSSSASAGWFSNYATYGDSVEPYGGGSCGSATNLMCH